MIQIGKRKIQVHLREVVRSTVEEALNACWTQADRLGSFIHRPCVVHSYGNEWTAVPTSKVKEVAAMLKAIHVRENSGAAPQKGEQVTGKLKD